MKMRRFFTSKERPHINIYINTWKGKDKEGGGGRGEREGEGEGNKLLVNIHLFEISHVFWEVFANKILKFMFAWLL